MQKTPKGLRLQIGIFGRRNAGKSSLLNALTNQSVSIVSDVPGTTTDPVEKAMELLPIGPVLFIDTAGVDDLGALGEERIKKSMKVIERTDLALLVTVPGEWGKFEDDLLEQFKKLGTPVLVVFNKVDLHSPTADELMRVEEMKLPYIETVAKNREGITDFREKILSLVPEEFVTPATIVGDLIPPGELVVLVTPIDLEAPKGRLILPQVQTIRDTLDNDAYCMVVKERELRDALERLNRPPALVITDSQAFLKVSADTPDEIPMTSFSVLFARFKGDLETFAEGAKAIDSLKSGDKVLIAEACTHHPIGEDIGRVKIPRWLRQYVGGDITFEVNSGHDFPENLSDYALVIHCGSCTFNRRHVLTRIAQCKALGVPITNYGMAIAFTLGIFERALKPFPELSDFA